MIEIVAAPNVEGVPSYQRRVALTQGAEIEADEFASYERKVRASDPHFDINKLNAFASYGFQQWKRAKAANQRADAQTKEIERLRSVKDEAQGDYDYRIRSALHPAPPAAPAGEIEALRSAISTTVVALSHWQDEHHDCDCPPHHSCGCKEFRDIRIGLECALIDDAALSASPAPGASETGVEIALTAYNAVWDAAPGITAGNVEIVRREAMTAALATAERDATERAARLVDVERQRYEEEDTAMHATFGTAAEHGAVIESLRSLAAAIRSGGKA